MYWLMVFIAWFGHAFNCTVCLNLVYAEPWPRKLLRGLRYLTGGIVFAFPLAAYWLTYNSTSWRDLALPVAGYALICSIATLVIVPMLTIMRWLRPTPKQVLAESSHVIDIAADLGYRPLGYGKHWRQARVPGNQLLQVEFVERTLLLPRLPQAWDCLTILHLSDLHFHGTPERAFFQRLIERINERGIPDLVCITGDVVDTVWHQLWIKPLLGQLKWREAGLAILGNHDLWCRPDGVRRQLRRAGFTVLGNGRQLLHVRGEPLMVLGHEGPWFSGPISPVAEGMKSSSSLPPGAEGLESSGSLPPCGGGLGWGVSDHRSAGDDPLSQPSPARGEGAKASSPTEREGAEAATPASRERARAFRLLLSHTPDNIGWARTNDVDLMLSGHCHGGQVRLPVIGPLFVPSRYSRKYDQGVFFEAPTLLSMSRGLSGREPLRLNCHPEVTWLTLKAP